MAMPQRDYSIETIKRLDALLEYAVMHGDEAERIREERTGGCVGFAEGRRSRGPRTKEYSPLRRLRRCAKLSALSGIDAPGGAIQRKPSGPDPFLKYSGSARAG